MADTAASSEEETSQHRTKVTEVTDQSIINGNEKEATDDREKKVDEKAEEKVMEGSDDNVDKKLEYQEMKLNPSLATDFMSKSSTDYGTSLLQDGIFFDNAIQINPGLVDSLTHGFTQKFLPSLEKNRKTISQIKTSQNVLVETVQAENAKFSECLAHAALNQTMSRAKVYQAKLLRLRKEMTALCDKSARLKRRALRLQQQKQKEEMTRAQQMEVEYEREKLLTARVAGSDSPSH